jgi:hypothetical protein
MRQARHLLKIRVVRFPKRNAGRDNLPNMRRLGSMLISYTLPIGLSLWGAALTLPCSLFIFGRPEMGFSDAFLTALMSATMAAAPFYYAGSQLLRGFGLPPDTTMTEFHEFMTGRSGEQVRF